jgi:hypothetical protein
MLWQITSYSIEGDLCHLTGDTKTNEILTAGLPPLVFAKSGQALKVCCKEDLDAHVC